MNIKQGILFSMVGVCLSIGTASASETKQHNATSPASSVNSTTVLSNEFAGELRTTETYTAKNSEIAKKNKVDLTKAMIGKFRINGI